MSERHFFHEVSCESWGTWIIKRIFGGQPAQPKHVSCPLDGKSLQKSVTGTWPIRARPEYAAEYTRFLQMFFYNSSSEFELKIPVHFLEYGLKNGSIVGVEIRDKDKILVGCVFDLYAGKYNTVEMGLVTWMCVAPSWRKRGVGSDLLFALYFFSQPRRIHWWRNDGVIQSPLPPFWYEKKIFRKRQIQRTVISGQKQLHLTKSSLSRWKSKFIEQWKSSHPTGIILDDTEFETEFGEVWEIQFSPTLTAAIYIQPTFEKTKKTQENWCEIIAWAWSRPTIQHYEQAQLLEKMLDLLPYDWFESSNQMPHFEHGWSNGPNSSWSCICLDYGIPALKPILSLCIN
jgi:GNAT superfamily N-acetyltransferase